jgi:hypothetical protein
MLLTSPFFYRRFVAHAPIPPTLVDDVVTHVLGPSPDGAARPTAATPAPASRDRSRPG